MESEAHTDKNAASSAQQFIWASLSLVVDEDPSGIGSMGDVVLGLHTIGNSDVALLTHK
jgi:hypothetical protein